MRLRRAFPGGAVDGEPFRRTAPCGHGSVTVDGSVMMWRIGVGNDVTVVVGNDVTFGVGNDVTIGVGNDVTVVVGNDVTVVVGNDVTIMVGNGG